ncbi:MAG: hypothetical protein ACOYIR_06360 [Christensenellales bacterium]|jgi:hypothetical protein
MYADYAFSIGYLIALCALCGVFTGIASPFLRSLSIRPFSAGLTLFSLVILASLDGLAAAIFMLIPALVLAFSMRWATGSLIAVLSAVSLGCVVFGVMSICSSLPSPGVYGGAAAAVLCALLLYRRIRLGAAFGSIPFAVMISFIFEGAFGVVLPLSQSAFFDAAVTVSILAPAVTLICERAGLRLREV